MSFHLSIVTPLGKIFDEVVESLTAPGELGGFGVLSGHAPMVAKLTDGPLKISVTNREKFYALGAGILEVNHGHDVLILSDSAHEHATLADAKNDRVAEEKI